MEKLKAFYAKVTADENLKAKFDKIVDSVEGEPTDKNFQEVVALAKEVGVEISVADIKNYLESQDKNSEELTNGELEMVAGGKRKWIRRA